MISPAFTNVSECVRFVFLAALVTDDGGGRRGSFTLRNVDKCIDVNFGKVFPHWRFGRKFIGNVDLKCAILTYLLIC